MAPKNGLQMRLGPGGPQGQVQKIRAGGDCEVQHDAEGISGGEKRERRTRVNRNLAVNLLPGTRRLSDAGGRAKKRKETPRGHLSRQNLGRFLPNAARLWFQMAARLGLEPRQAESESAVLPLHHRARNTNGTGKISGTFFESWSEARCASGAGDGIRTRNRLFTKQVLYR